MAKKIKCYKCSAEISSGSKHCPFCGADQSIKEEFEKQKNRQALDQSQRSTVACPKCSTPVSASTKFCPKCGSSIRGDVEGYKGGQRGGGQTGGPANGPSGPVGPVNGPNGPVGPTNGPNGPVGPTNGPNGPVRQPVGPTNGPAGPGRKSGGGKKLGLILGASIGSIALLAVLIIAALFLMKPTVNLKKYSSMNIYGYNTVGKAEYYFQSDDAINAMSESKRYYVETILDNSSYDISKETNISNGEEITVTWNIDENLAKQYGIKFTNTTLKYTAKDLQEANTFDPFAWVAVSFTGIDGEGIAQYSVDESKQTVDGTFEYYFEEDSGLSVGDTVTLTLDISDEEIADMANYNSAGIPSPLSKSVTIKDGDLAAYVTDYKQINNDCLQNIENEGYNIYNGVADSTITSQDEYFKGVTYIGNYFLTGNNTDPRNSIYAVYKAHIFNAVNGTKKNSYIYWYVKFDNIGVYGNGNNYVDFYNYETATNTTHIYLSARDFTYQGYASVNELYKSVIEPQSSSYTITNNVKDTANGDTSITTEYKPQSSPASATEKQDGIIFPDSSSRKLSSSEISNLSDSNLQKAINEIYARNGYIFNDKEKGDYYKKYSWYKPTIPAASFTEDLFNSTEKANVQALQDERDRRK